MKSSLRLAARFLCAASVPSVFAAGADAPVPEEAAPVAHTAAKSPVDDTVVVASRSREKLLDTAPSISKVSAEEMRVRDTTSLVDALAGQQGMYVARSGGVGSQSSVFTRGTSSNSTAFLLDGRRLNSGFSGSYEIFRYTTANLDSVQIARGASSTLYGANAIGGVVDMRSVDSLAVERNGGSVEVEAGSFATTIGKLSFAGNTDNLGDAALVKGLGVSVGATVTDTQNHRPNNDFTQASIMPRIDYRITDSVRADLVMHYSRDRYQLPGSLSDPTPGDVQRDEGFLVSPGFTFVSGDDFTGRVFYSASNLRVSGEQYGASYLYENDNNEVTAFGEYTLFKQAKLLVGYTYENQYFHTDSTYAVVHEGVINSNSPWVQLRVFPIEDLTLGAGYRYNAYNLYDSQSTYEVFGAYHLRETGTSFHAKVATAYRAPSAGDYAFGTLGKLSPEESVSYEFGIRQRFLDDKAHIGVAFYQNELKNMIGSQYDPVSYMYLTANLDRARTRGIELTADWKPERHVRLFFNGDLLHAVSLGDNSLGYLPGQRLLRRPDWTATIGIELYPTENITVGFSTTFVHGREDAVYPAPTYAREQVDMGNYVVGRVYGMWRVGDHLEVFGRVENLYDRRYEPAMIGYDALPIGAYAGVRLLY